MTFGRFGLSALVYADQKCLHAMLSNERAKYYGNKSCVQKFKNTDASTPTESKIWSELENATKSDESKFMASSKQEDKGRDSMSDCNNDEAAEQNEEKGRISAKQNEQQNFQAASETNKIGVSTNDFVNSRDPKTEKQEAKEAGKGQNDRNKIDSANAIKGMEKSMEKDPISRTKEPAANGPTRDNTISSNKASPLQENNHEMKSDEEKKREASLSNVIETENSKLDFSGPRDGKTSAKLEKSIHSLVPRVFQQNPKLRAGICMVLLHHGYPFFEDREQLLSKNIWDGIRKATGVSDGIGPPALFQARRFEFLLENICGDGVEIPETSVIKDYVEKYFLPHCLKLCLYGNGPSRYTRGSKEEYETFDGTSRYPDPTDHLQSPIPDPCLDLHQQSIEAVGMACAILRRARLMRCILHIASGIISMEDLNEISTSQVMRQSLDGLPVWWCPWIHDVALLVHASTCGLFSIIEDRKELDVMRESVFSRDAIMEHIQSRFVSDQQVVPARIYDQSSVDDYGAWIKMLSDEFPSQNVIERRLSFLCAKATENLEGDFRFDNFPMYDHGAWPRN
jgi:hypothetical protein